MLSARRIRLQPVTAVLALLTALVLGLAACGSVPAPATDADRPPQALPAPSTPAASGQSDTPPTASAVMDERRFWSIIASTRTSRDTSDRVALLHGTLKTLPPPQVADFDRQLTRAVNTIGEPEHLGAAEILMGFTSRQAFTDLRAWVVAQGESVHGNFRDDPDSLADAGLDREGELVAGQLFALAPDTAYRELTGRNLVDDFPDLPVPDTRSSSPEGPSYAELAQELPRLADAYLPDPAPDGNAFADGPRGITPHR